VPGAECGLVDRHLSPVLVLGVLGKLLLSSLEGSEPVPRS
jgi:hypothetical protein